MPIHGGNPFELLDEFWEEGLVGDPRDNEAKQFALAKDQDALAWGRV
jgi:hypothetical protein